MLFPCKCLSEVFWVENANAGQKERHTSYCENTCLRCRKPIYKSTVCLLYSRKKTSVVLTHTGN